jgi:L-aminopeptidase/D-esterase-like protein
VHAGVDRWIAEQRPDLAAKWLLPVVAETWDGYLNDINGRHVRPEHAIDAIDAADRGPDEYDSLRFIPWGRMDPFYTAAVQSVEEAVLNSLIANHSMTGRAGHRTPSLPHDRLRQLLKSHDRLAR